MNAGFRRGVRTLVVDDKAFIRATMGRILEGVGISNVSFAANGGEAMELSATPIRPWDLYSAI